MSATNDNRPSASHVAVTDLRPLVLLRYRAGITGHTARTVHLAPMPLSPAEAITALCGVLLHPNQVEPVPAGHCREIDFIAALRPLPRASPTGSS